jgi:hypothetical protein
MVELTLVGNSMVDPLVLSFIQRECYFGPLVVPDEPRSAEIDPVPGRPGFAFQTIVVVDAVPSSLGTQF